MSRPRVIEQSEILDAAETVVARNGAARLTLDAVAIEAGISKASVIYDYKSKQALIKAVVERRVADDEDKLRLARDALGTTTNAAIKARITVAAETIPDDTQAVAFNLCSALAQDAELRNRMEQAYRRETSTILEQSTNPRAALLAFLAVEGLKTLEFLGLLTWPEKERARILSDIADLVAWPMDPALKNPPPVP